MNKILCPIGARWTWNWKVRADSIYADKKLVALRIGATMPSGSIVVTSWGVRIRHWEIWKASDRMVCFYRTTYLVSLLFPDLDLTAVGGVWYQQSTEGSKLNATLNSQSYCSFLSKSTNFRGPIRFFLCSTSCCHMHTSLIFQAYRNAVFSYISP